MTVYVNALSRLQHLQTLDAQKLGYYDTILRGTSLVPMLPMIPATDLMEDKYYELAQNTSKLYTNRVLNESAEVGEENEFIKRTEPQVIYTTTAQVDVILEQDKPGELDRRLDAKVTQKMMPGVDYDILNGDGSAKNLNGLKNRLTGEFLVNPVSGNLASTLNINSSVGNFQTFVDMLEFARYRLNVMPGYQVIGLMNERVYRACQSGARRLTANAIGSSMVDILNQQVPTIAQIPMIILRNNGQGQPMIPNNEGGGQDESSIYLAVVGPAPADVEQIPNAVYLSSAKSGDPFKTTVKPDLSQIKAGVDFVVGLRVPPRSAVRIRGIQTTGL